MSAFAPYKKVDKVDKVEDEPADLRIAKRDSTWNRFFRFPIDLTSALFELPVYQRRRSDFGIGLMGERMEDPADRKERFFIKNLLKREEAEEEKSAERQKSERTRRKFEEEASKMETIVSNLGKSEGGHRCIYCGKIYSRKYGLKIHIRTHTGYKPLKCKYCFRPFGDPSNLNKHVRLHARGHTPYSCQFCGKILVRRRDLERHVKSKHGEPS